MCGLIGRGRAVWTWYCGNPYQCGQQAPCSWGDVLPPSVVYSHERWGCGQWRFPKAGSHMPRHWPESGLLVLPEGPQLRPRATESTAVWVDAPTLRTVCVTCRRGGVPGKVPEERDWRAFPKNPGKKRYQAELERESIYLERAKQTSLRQRPGQGKNNVPRPLFKRWAFKVISNATRSSEMPSSWNESLAPLCTSFSFEPSSSHGQF